MGIRGSLVIQPCPSLVRAHGQRDFSMMISEMGLSSGVSRLRCHAVRRSPPSEEVSRFFGRPMLRLAPALPHHPPPPPGRFIYRGPPPNSICSSRRAELTRTGVKVWRGGVGELQWRYYGGPPLEIKLTRATWDALMTKATGKLIREMKDYELEGVKRVTC